MPISTSLYTELRFTISGYVQRKEWKRLFEVCGTENDEAARTIGVIMSGYDSVHTWSFVDFVLSLSSRDRIESERSVVTVCYIIARMGQSNVRKSLSYLRELLYENQNLRDPVIISISNLWIQDTKRVSKTLLKSWILKGDNYLLQDVAVRSCEYLAQNDPKKVAKFLASISKLEVQETASKTARLIMKRYAISGKARKSKKRSAKHRGKNRKKRRKK